MKKFTSVLLVAVIAVSVVSCGKASTTRTYLSATSSAESYLTERFGFVPENVILGDEETGAAYGVDMTDFDDDGYIVRTLNEKTLVLGKTEDGLDRAARYYANHVFGEDAAVNKVYGEGAKVKSFTVGGRSVADFVITVTEEHPEDGYPEATAFAATELAEVIRDATRINVPVVKESELSEDVPYFRLTCDGSDDNGTDGFTVTVTPEGNVEILGGVKRGCLYAAYDIAERWLGTRFVAYDYTYIYEADEICITEADSYSDAPAGNMRYLSSYSPNKGIYGFVQKTAFAAKNKLNGNPSTVQYGYAERVVTHHGLYIFWGTESNAHNLCYNDDYLNEGVIEAIEEAIKNAEASGALYNGTHYNISLGQNDSNVFCECADCLAVASEEGSYSGNVIRQANMIADHFRDEYPQVLFNVFAYWGTEKPCKTKVADNVSVEYCIIGACYSGPLDGSECREDRVGLSGYTPAEEKKNILGWLELVENFDVRLYYFTSQFYAPNNAISNLHADIGFLYELGVRNVYTEITESVFAFDHPASWLWSKMVWNPTMSEEEYDALKEEIIMLTYGEGYELILDYIELYDSYILCTDRNTWGADLDYIKIGASAEYALGLFEEAESAADTARAAKNVRNLKAHVIFNAMCVWYEDKAINGSDEDKEYMLSLAHELRDIVISSGVQDAGLTEVTLDDIDWESDPRTWDRRLSFHNT